MNELDWENHPLGPAWCKRMRPGMTVLCLTGEDPEPTTRSIEEIIEETASLPRVTAKRCINVAARLSELRPEDITGPRRSAAYVTARDLALALILDRCRHLSQSQMARELNRDHSTIIAARARIEKLMRSPQFEKTYKRARAAV